MGRADSQSSSSSSSSCSIAHRSNHPPAAVLPNSSLSSSSSPLHISNCRRNCKPDLSTDLSLGLSISSPRQHDLLYPSKLRVQQSLDWPPIKSILRNTLEERVNNRLQKSALFVKVYMEGVPIGRKLNLLAHDSYDSLIKALSQMFRIIIQCPDRKELRSGQNNILTYQDEEGDWMMVGDVPWEMFIASVKRLKITRAERC